MITRRRGFDTEQEQYVRGEKYDPRNQWGSGPFERTSSVESSSRVVYPDLPFGGYFMTGDQIAQAGPADQERGDGSPVSGGRKMRSWKYPDPPGPAASQVERDFHGETMDRLKKTPTVAHTIGAGRLNNLWSPKHVPAMKDDTLTGEHQRVLEWVLRQMGKTRG